MRDAQPRTIYLRDYRPPAFTIGRVELHLELFDSHALVHARLHFHRAADTPAGTALTLQGEELELESIALDGEALDASRYELADDTLRLPAAPERGVLATTARIYPQNNTSLEGLYRSRTMFCTQCEAEGFRRITYFLDRPDVMARYRVTLDRRSRRYPVLLSNGNPRRRASACRTGATWPLGRPLSEAELPVRPGGRRPRCVEDASRPVRPRRALRIYVEPENLRQVRPRHGSLSARHALGRGALRSRVRSRRVQHRRRQPLQHGRDGEQGPQHLQRQVHVWRARTRPPMSGLRRYRSVVAHEYFHNWTGNRITCRDWFQLSLKEGFTVYRDQEFSADMGSRGVKRIGDVRMLRARQFAEDAGPMAHPVRPDSYIEINNFYTATVYEKGAEVVRMQANLLGPERFPRVAPTCTSSATTDRR
jgi:aminopeptidase N